MAEVKSFPLVTIAIPTYDRPAMLVRALDCVFRQDYPNIELLIADNCSPGNEACLVVESFKNKCPNLKFTRHAKNIGAVNNFFGLLAQANGKYFMWLADDDEISSNYVSALTQLLEDTPDAATAAGHWVLMSSPDRGECMPTMTLPQRSSFIRAVRYIWDANDAFFYGLHRTELLRQAKFRNYCWPNKNELWNWAYVFLLDMILAGPLLLPHDKSVRWINHNYTEKDHPNKHKHNNLFFILKYLSRRVNVHFLYLTKIRRKLGYFIMASLMVVSFLSLFREFTYFFGGIARRKIKRLVNME